MSWSTVDAFESISSKANFEHHKLYTLAKNVVSQVDFLGFIQTLMHTARTIGEGAQDSGQEIRGINANLVNLVLTRVTRWL